MRTFILTSAVLFLLQITAAGGFQCYLCRGMQYSLDVCDQKIEKASCDTHAKGADRCGIFSFVNGSGIRTFGKSCVFKRFCDDKKDFCNSVSTHLGEAKECNILCCTEEFCNYNSSRFKEVFNGNSNGDADDDDSEDCDWIDTSSSLGVSGFLIGVCALYLITFG